MEEFEKQSEGQAEKYDEREDLGMFIRMRGNHFDYVKIQRV